MAVIVALHPTETASQGSALLSLTDAKTLAKTKGVETTITLDGVSLSFATQGTSQTFRRVDATFPPLTQVLPALTYPNVRSPTLSNVLHAKIADMITIMCGKKHAQGIRLLATSEDSTLAPVLVTVPDMLIVAMPYREKDGSEKCDIESFRNLLPGQQATPAVAA